jgi:hypothetical protein
MTGQEMVDAVNAKLGVDNNATNDANALEFLNTAQDVIARRHNFRVLESETSSSFSRTSVAGATISEGDNSKVRLTSAGNFDVSNALFIGATVNCDFSATYTDGDYDIVAVDTTSGNYIDIDLTYSTDVPTATVLLPMEFYTDVPDDFKEFISARYEVTSGHNRGELKTKSAREMDVMVYDSTNRRSNYPRYIATYGKPSSSALEFRLYPTPNEAGTLSLRYYKDPSAIVDDSSTPDLEHVSDVIVAGAVWLGFQQERAWESSGQWEGIFRRRLQEAINDDSDNQGWTPQLQPHKMYPSSTDSIFDTDYEIDTPTDYWT